MIPLKQRFGTHDESWRAKPAVNRTGVNIGLLDGLPCAVCGDPFDGQHAFAECLYCQHGAGIDRPPVYDDRAGAAFADVAAPFGAGQAAVVPQQCQQRHRPRRDDALRRLDTRAVHRDL